jgi:protein-L-isoaspartate(D-aspartate) O-methyltransferase
VNLGLRPGLVHLTLPFLLLLVLSSVVSTVHPASAAAQDALSAKLASRGIRDARVLAAFAKVSRDLFVSPDASERAFDNKPLPATYTQIISQPYLLARMFEALQVKPDARILEVGTGTGYAVALLSELAGEVFSVGVIPETAATARLRLAREGYQNVHVKLGEGALGWREYGPYDAIVVTSVASRVSPTLIEQLVEGGVLVMPVGPPRGRQVLLRGVKQGFKLHAKEVAELHPAPGADRPGGTDRTNKDAVPPTSRRKEPAGAAKERRPARDPDDSRSDR